MPVVVAPDVRSPVRNGGREGFGRAVLAALAGDGGEFSVETSSPSALRRPATQLRLWLLVTRMNAGGVSATVSPEFLRDTYPAMLDLTRALDEAGLKGAWRPEGDRTIRLGEARHVFVSVDRPLTRPRDGSGRPDTLLEVVSAERIDPEWYRTRVAPRAGVAGLTTVVYGARGGLTLFDQVRKRHLLEEWGDGSVRHFSFEESGSVIPAVQASAQ